MSRWIRWKGLLAFVIILGVIGVIWFFLIDGIVERVIERTGSRMVGAKVELADAGLSLFPIGLSLRGLQVTNPEEPMRNAVEVEEIGMSVETGPLLMRKVIIEEMTLAGVRLNTERTESGALPEREERTTGERARRLDWKSTGLPSLDVPDVKDILAREELNSLRLIESLTREIEDQEQQWRKRLAELPNRAAIEAYRARIEQLGKGKKGVGDILGGVKEVEEIRREIRRDIDRVKDARAEYQKAARAFRERQAEIQSAPREDLLRLREKYAPSPENIGNIAGLLFQERMGGWIERAFSWYDRLKPVVGKATAAGEKGGKKGETPKPGRGTGIDVQFREKQPAPDFLIRRAMASFATQAGEMSGTIEHITTDQAVLGIPLTFAFSGRNLKDFGSVDIEGSAYHASGAGIEDRVSARINRARIGGLTISDSPAMPVTLREGIADLVVDARLSGSAIDAQVRTDVQSAAFATVITEDSGRVARAIATALSGISRFSLIADMEGTLDDPRLTMRSDLDRLLNNAVKTLVAEQSERVRQELESAIKARVDQPMRELTAAMGDLNGVDGEIQKRIDMLQTTLDDAVKQKAGGVKLPF
ncbi:MAG: TIGR03545 family protein [bacterium]